MAAAHLSLAWCYQMQKSSNYFSPQLRDTREVCFRNPCYCTKKVSLYIRPAYLKIHCSRWWRPLRRMRSERLGLEDVGSCVSIVLHSSDGDLINWHRVKSLNCEQFSIWSHQQCFCAGVRVQLCHYCSFTSFFLCIKLRFFKLAGWNSGSRRLFLTVHDCVQNTDHFVPALSQGSKESAMMSEQWLFEAVPSQIEIQKSDAINTMVIMDSDFHKELMVVSPCY